MVKNRPLIAIVGPTGVGKTEISLEIAERLNGEIVSADSRLFYRGMNIGTAKPSRMQRARVPHHLIDVSEPDQVWSLVKFQRAAYAIIDEIHSRARLPFLVGGTGQYIFAVVEGWNIPDVRPDPRLRSVLAEWAQEFGPEGLYDRLMVLDSEAADRIDPQNLRRIIRAIEVIFSSGRRFSKLRKKTKPRFQTLILGLSRPRQLLYERVDARIQAMLDSGFVGEVEALLSKGYSPDLPPLSAIGYRQVIQYIQGDITLDEAVTLMKRYTRRYVRRQANWFKQDDARIHWFEYDVDITQHMTAQILKFLEGSDFINWV
jgi:tRNA dimethylallyltransferase